ncbi:MAG: 3-isopropylmalate dehydrogenase [Hyphomicrobiaceae bacterium]
MASTAKILALGGDGIGPEVVDAGLEILTCVTRDSGLQIEVEHDLLHGAAYDAHGVFCRDETVRKARAADAVLVGAVGGPKWDSLEIEGGPAEKDGLVRLRQELDVYAGLRPARCYDALIDKTPFRPEHVRGTDLMVVRELCSGLYFGEPRGIDRLPGGGLAGYDANYYTSAEIERIARVGFELARRRSGRLASLDKANVMESGVLWRRIVTRIGAEDYPDVALTHLYADNAVYQFIKNPKAFDVILGDNLIGDIVSDLVGVVAGSLAMLPSASLTRLTPEGTKNHPAIYEAVHGSAPDIAGKGIANPIGTILSVAMMLRHSLARPDLARRVEVATDNVLADGVLTPDLGGTATTGDVVDAMISVLRA